MQELESVCVEIGRERKSITASLKDLDSVVSKLDAILVFFVLVATLLVLLSLISQRSAGVLTSAGSAVSFSTTSRAGNPCFLLICSRSVRPSAFVAFLRDCSGVPPIRAVRSCKTSL